MRAFRVALGGWAAVGLAILAVCQPGCAERGAEKVMVSGPAGTTTTTAEAPGVAAPAAALAPAPMAGEPTAEATDGTSTTRANTEAYDRIVDNAFVRVAQEPLSTFSIDVDTASYTHVRRF